jgi:hypothetical protein
MPSEIEKLMQEIIQAAPTVINQEESQKNLSAALMENFKKLNTQRPTAAKANPEWEAAINNLSLDDLYKLTYCFMRHKKNTTSDNALLRGSELPSCKILYEAYATRCSKLTPPQFDIKVDNPIISDKFQALHKLMYDTHLDLRTNDPAKAVAVEVSFGLYGQASPPAPFAALVAEQVKNSVSINLPAPVAPTVTTPTTNSPSSASSSASLFQPTRKTPPPLPHHRDKQMEAPEEILAIVFQERLTALKSDLAKYKKNEVATKLLQDCQDLEKAFGALSQCYKSANYKALEGHHLLNAVSFDLSTNSGSEKVQMNLFTFKMGVEVLDGQLERRLQEAIKAENKKATSWLASKPDAGLLKDLASDVARKQDIHKILLDPETVGKLGRPSLR